MFIFHLISVRLSFPYIFPTPVFHNSTLIYLLLSPIILWIFSVLYFRISFLTLFSISSLTFLTGLHLCHIHLLWFYFWTWALGAVIFGYLKSFVFFWFSSSISFLSVHVIVAFGVVVGVLLDLLVGFTLYCLFCCGTNSFRFFWSLMLITTSALIVLW